MSNTLNPYAIFDSVATVQEVCAMYYVAPHTVYYWINRGYVTACWVGFWLVSVDSLEQFRTPLRKIHHVREQSRFVS